MRVVGRKFACCRVKSVQAISGPDPNEMRGSYINGRDTVIPQCARIARIGFVEREPMGHGIEVLETRLEGAEPQRSLLVFRKTDIDLLEAAVELRLIDVETLLIPIQ